MRKYKVITHYKDRVTEEGLAVLGGKVVAAMTENINLTTPNPPLDEFAAFAEDYREKLELASGGSTLDKKRKDTSRDKLLRALRILAQYVNNTAEGDLPILVSSGLILAKQPEALSGPIIVTNLLLKDGEFSREMRVDFATQDRIFDYEIQLGIIRSGTETITWEPALYTTTSKGNILKPLNPAERYYVRVRARNAKGTGDWSDTASLIVR